MALSKCGSMYLNSCLPPTWCCGGLSQHFCVFHIVHTTTLNRAAYFGNTYAAEEALELTSYHMEIPLSELRSAMWCRREPTYLGIRMELLSPVGIVNLFLWGVLHIAR